MKILNALRWVLTFGVLFTYQSGVYAISSDEIGVPVEAETSIEVIDPEPQTITTSEINELETTETVPLSSPTIEPSYSSDSDALAVAAEPTTPGVCWCKDRNGKDVRSLPLNSGTNCDRGNRGQDVGDKCSAVVNGQATGVCRPPTFCPFDTRGKTCAIGCGE